MASSFSSLLALELMATGENENTWGDKTNDNLEKLINKLSGRLSITLAGADVTLTQVNGGDGSGSTNPANMIIHCSGSPGATRDVIVPNQPAIYVLHNELSTAQSAGIRTSAGSPVTADQNESKLVFCDGSDGMFEISAISTGTISEATNALNLGGVPAASYAQLAVKQSWTRPQRATPNRVTLVANAYTPDADVDSHIIVEQSEIGASNVTINNPSGTPTDGQWLIVDIEQHGSTPVSVVWGSTYIFPDNVDQDMTQTADAVDGWAFQYDSGLGRWKGKGAAFNFPRS